MDKPLVASVGRDVHYVTWGGSDGARRMVCRAAKVTEVGEEGRVGLVVFKPHGVCFHPLAKDGGVGYFDRNDLPEGVVFEGDVPGVQGTWHWPEQVHQQ